MLVADLALREFNSKEFLYFYLQPRKRVLLMVFQTEEKKRESILDR